MPFNLKSRRPPDISNNDATDIIAGEGVSRGAVRGPFNSVQKAMYEYILPPRLKTPGRYKIGERCWGWAEWALVKKKI